MHIPTAPSLCSTSHFQALSISILQLCTLGFRRSPLQTKFHMNSRAQANQQPLNIQNTYQTLPNSNKRHGLPPPTKGNENKVHTPRPRVLPFPVTYREFQKQNKAVIRLGQVNWEFETRTHGMVFSNDRCSACALGFHHLCVSMRGEQKQQTEQREGQLGWLVASQPVEERGTQRAWVHRSSWRWQWRIGSEG